MKQYEDARRLAGTWVEIVSRGTADIPDEHTLTRPYGWVFFWSSKRFIRTRDPMDGFVGNAPVIVERVNFELRCTGTGRPIEHYLRSTKPQSPRLASG
jgi:hypothetical protein